MHLYLIRRAESYGNIRGKIISTTDFELTDKGIAQSRCVGEELRAKLHGTPISAYPGYENWGLFAKRDYLKD